MVNVELTIMEVCYKSLGKLCVMKLCVNEIFLIIGNWVHGGAYAIANLWDIVMQTVLKICNCGRAKCEPTVVFSVGWSVALKKLCSKVLAKSVHILGMPVLYQLKCVESSREGPGVEFKFHMMTDAPAVIFPRKIATCLFVSNPRSQRINSRNHESGSQNQSHL